MGQWGAVVQVGWLHAHFGCIHNIAVDPWQMARFIIGLAFLAIATANNLESKELECSTVLYKIEINRLENSPCFEDIICGCPSDK